MTDVRLVERRGIATMSCNEDMSTEGGISNFEAVLSRNIRTIYVLCDLNIALGKILPFLGLGFETSDLPSISIFRFSNMAAVTSLVNDLWRGTLESSTALFEGLKLQTKRP